MFRVQEEPLAHRSLRHYLVNCFTAGSAAAGENSTDRNCNRQSQRAYFVVPRYSGKRCKSSVTLRGKISCLSIAYTEGNRDRVPGIVAELMRLKVDILFSTQAIVIRAAKQATKTIPIVMAITPDPVAMGLVDSLARPGGNITGLTWLTRELSGKRLELLTEMIPRLSRVGILSVAGFTAFKDYEDAARSLKVPLQPLEVRVPTPDLPRAFQVAVKERVSAIIVTSVPGLSGYRKQIVDLAVQNRLPLMSESIYSCRSWRPCILRC